MLSILREYGLLVLAVVALLAVSTLSLYGLRKMVDQGEVIYENGVENLQEISNLKLTLKTQHARVLGAPAELDMGKIAEYQEAIKSEKDGLLKTLEKIEKEAQVQGVVALYQAYLASAEKIFGFAKLFAQKQGTEELTNIAEPAYTEIDTILYKVYTKSKKTAHENLISMESVASQMKKAIVIIGVVLVSLILVIGGYLGYLQSRQKASTRAVVQNVQDVLAEVQGLARSMSGEAEAMLQAANSVGKNIASTASAADETSANMSSVSAAVEELSATTVQITDQVSKSSTVADRAIEETHSAGEAVSSMNDSVNQINSFISMITDIAEQTNLLALNAAIEAARAGDAGRGFAVVADEVRKLSSQTNEAASDIVEQVKSITVISQEVSEAISHTTDTVEQMKDITNHVGHAVQEQNQATHDISASIVEVTSNMDHVSTDVGAVKTVSSDVEKNSTHIKDHVTQLVEKTGELQSKLNRFTQSLFGG